MTKGLRSGLFAASPLLSDVANGVLLNCGTTQSGRSRWRSDAIPSNLGLTGAIAKIAVFFDAATFPTRSPSSSVAWDAIVLLSDPATLARGCFDALALGNGILGVQSQSGFSVRFDSLGSEVPSNQPFERRGSTSLLSRREAACLDWGGLQSPAVARTATRSSRLASFLRG